MKLRRTKIQGVGRFRDSVEVDLDTLGDAQVVAIVGPNGAGKTTLIETANTGAVYRELPSRGSIARMANTPSSVVESVIETDQAYTIKHAINASRKTPKVESYIFDAAGNPLNPDGKQGTFQSEVDKRFPTQRVYLASGFAAQKKNGQFLEVPKAERKALFADMLGFEHLQVLSSSAGAKASEVEAKLAALEGRRVDLEAAERDREHLEAQVEVATIAATAATEKREAIEKQARRASEGYRQWSEKRLSIAQLKAEAVQAEAEARKDLATHLSRMRDQEEQLAKIGGDIARLEQQLQERPRLKEVVDAAPDKTAIEAVSTAILALQEAQTSYLARHRNWEQERQRLQRDVEQLGNDLSRTERTAKGLASVPCGGEGEYATCPLIAGATEARARLPRLQESLLEAEEALASHPKAPEPPDSGELPALKAELANLERRRTEAIVAKTKLESLTRVESQVQDLTTAAAELRHRIGEGREQKERLTVSLHAAGVNLATREAALTAHEQDVPESVDDSTISAARSDERAAQARVSEVAQQLTAARQASQRLSVVLKDIGGLLNEAADWRHLQKALGRDGVQSLEVDAAGPEVSDLINELLHTGYGNRFSCALETTALKADGRGTKEIFDLRVIDSEMGTDGSASDLSGGERVIVAEAISLAIAIHHARKSSIPILDLWRDECAGALYPDTAPLYVEMLRKALDLGGFHRVYFIAHQPELWAMADATIRVKDGHAWLDSGGVAPVRPVVTQPVETEAA